MESEDKDYTDVFNLDIYIYTYTHTTGMQEYYYIEYLTLFPQSQNSWNGILELAQYSK